MPFIPFSFPLGYGGTEQTDCDGEERREVQGPQDHVSMSNNTFALRWWHPHILRWGIPDIITLELLKLFSVATGMEINGDKSTISFSNCTRQETQLALQNFPYQILALKDGLKYLVFRIKADGYKIADWTWLIAKVEKGLNNWSHRLHSRVGRLVLIKAVLEATPVFWMSLAWIPQGILHRIQWVCCHFLWKGHKGGKPYAWVKWSRITTPKKWGGWGLKHLPTFAQWLATKLG